MAKKNKKSKNKKEEKKKSGGKLKEKDFVNLEYTGKTKDGEVFDTNIKEEAEKIGIKIETRPLTICLGQNMILPSIDKFLIGKEAEKEYKLELKPEDAFGKRKRELVKTMPISVFEKQNVNPRRGMTFAFDRRVGKIISVSGGRVIVDFNNPLANKEVVYNLYPKKKIEDKEKKIKVLIKTFFKKEFDFKIKNKNLILKLPEQLKSFGEIYKEKFKEILDLNLKIEELSKKKSEVGKEKMKKEITKKEEAKKEGEEVDEEEKKEEEK